MAATLATAYLHLKAEMNGVKKDIETELGGVDTKKAGQKVGKSLGENTKVGLGKIALGNFLGNALTSGVSMAVEGIGQIVGGAFEQAKNYEQLVGGVDKLFGEASGQLQAYANEAYKTAGLSANEYMEQATSFSASLITSLGGDTGLAANYADEAIKDMADNVNVFGSNMEDVQNAYQGFAKGNFTMLDNLKLGYGGTKEEMNRLLRHAEEVNGYMEGSLSADNFADIIEAIHTVQEEMSIAGTTEKEAMGTVEGSINATKAAWDNFLLALGTGEGVSTAMTNLVTSAGAAAQNLLPVMEQIFYSLGDIVGQAIGYILTHIPDILAAAGQLILALVSGLANGIAPTMEALNSVVQAGLDAVGGFVGDMLEAGANLVQGLIDGIAGAIGGVTDTILGGLQGAVDGALSFLGIASPSKLFAQMGNYTMQGLAQGIDGGTKQATAAMRSAVSDVYGAARGSASFAASASYSVTGASGVGDTIKSELNGMGVYLDGRALVGGIAPRMDKALGGFA